MIEYDIHDKRSHPHLVIIPSSTFRQFHIQNGTTIRFHVNVRRGANRTGRIVRHASVNPRIGDGGRMDVQDVQLAAVLTQLEICGPITSERCVILVPGQLAIGKSGDAHLEGNVPADVHVHVRQALPEAWEFRQVDERVVNQAPEARPRRIASGLCRFEWHNATARGVDGQRCR